MYEAFYKLEAKPFQLNPDPRFFFGSSGHKRVLAYLRYGIAQGEGFVVVTGEVGAGKTTLIRTLLQELSQDRKLVIGQLVTTQLDPDQLLGMIASAFGVEHDGLTKAALIRRLEAFLIRQAHTGKRVLLIVDEAQNIPLKSLEEMRMLSNLQVGTRSLLQSVLLGQAEFRDLLRSQDSEQLRQRIIASHHLGPLNLEETQGYIEHRLSHVGWGGDPVFTPEAYAGIYDFTGGVPRRINTLCDRVLLYGYLEELHQIDAEIVHRVTEELDQEFPYIEPGEAPAPQTFAGVPQLADLERRVAVLEETLNRTRAAFKAAFSDGVELQPLQGKDRRHER